MKKLLRLVSPKEMRRQPYLYITSVCVQHTLRMNTNQKPRARKKYSIDCVNAKNGIITSIDRVDLSRASCSSCVYFSSTDVSIVKDETVRIAVTASEAKDALAARRCPVMCSRRLSRRIFSHPEASKGGRPPNTMTRPSFHEYASARMEHATALTTERQI